jgi:hypothetical protein
LNVLHNGLNKRLLSVVEPAKSRLGIKRDPAADDAVTQALSLSSFLAGEENNREQGNHRI